MQGANMKYCAVAFLLLCSTFGIAKVGQVKSEKPPTEFEQALITAESGFIAAARKGDSAFFKQMLANDFSFVSYDGQLYERQDMVDQRCFPRSGCRGSGASAAVSALHNGLDQAG